jgi:hypothetical protein
MAVLTPPPVAPQKSGLKEGLGHIRIVAPDFDTDYFNVSKLKPMWGIS